jgi:hypothetical protein
MPITFFCPVCNVQVEVPDRLAGKTAPCPVCRNAIDVPAPSRPAGAGHHARRLRPALFGIAAACASAVLVALLITVQTASRALEEEVGAIRQRLAALETAAAHHAQEPPPTPKPIAPTPTPPPAAPPKLAAALDDHAALTRDIAALRDTQEGIFAKLRDLEDAFAKSKGAPAPAAPPPEIASDDNIEVKLTVRLDGSLPRHRFIFTGTVTNTDTKPAPVVQVTIRITSFHGHHHVTRQPVTTIMHTATLSERIRSLPPGTTSNIWKEYYPAEPAILSREFAWVPQFEVTTRVLAE